LPEIVTHPGFAVRLYLRIASQLEKCRAAAVEPIQRLSASPANILCFNRICPGYGRIQSVTRILTGYTDHSTRCLPVTDCSLTCSMGLHSHCKCGIRRFAWNLL